MLRVLYDGWSLTYEPLSPAALHLLALLENLPADVEPIVALPGNPPSWLPETIDTHVHSIERGSARRLRWEQRILPGLAKSSSARLLHMTTSNPALFAATPTVVSPSEYRHRERRKGITARAREALSQGGMAGVRGVLWPADLPKPGFRVALFNLPPIVSSWLGNDTGGSGTQTGSLDLPETFILYHGPYRESDLRRLVAAWSWADEPLGDYYPVYLLGIDEVAQERIAELMHQFSLTGALYPVPSATPPQLAQLYRACALLFHPAEVTPWGSAVRYALACGKPVVALDTPLTDAMVGNAAYLLNEGDARAQGAALITVTGEQEFADKLASAAQERSAAWDADDFGNQLLEAYHVVLD